MRICVVLATSTAILLVLHFEIFKGILLLDGAAMIIMSIHVHLKIGSSELKGD